MTASPLLSLDAVAIIDKPGSFPMASVISIWEVAVKWAIRRGRPQDMPMSGTAFVAELLQAGVPVLDVMASHAAALDDLALHHRDPFDRFLVAQAQAEAMILLTQNKALAAYGDCVMVV